MLAIRDRSMDPLRVDPRHDHRAFRRSQPLTYAPAVPELQFPTPPLADKTVLLRPWREADVPNNLMAFSDPVIQRFSWSQAAPFTEEDARAYFVDQEQARLRGEEVQFALVEPQDEDDVLGGGSLYELNLAQGCAAVGYWLAPQARGRGVASTAVRLLAGAVGVHAVGVGSDRADVWAG